MRSLQTPRPFLRRRAWELLVPTALAGWLALGCEESQYQVGPQPKDSKPVARAPIVSREPVPARLRLKNASDFDFDSVEVALTSDGLDDFGALPALALSEYRDVLDLYPRTYIHALHGAAEYFYFVTDYSGDSVLLSGDYTYVLMVYSASGGGISIELVKDPILENPAPSGAEP